MCRDAGFTFASLAGSPEKPQNSAPNQNFKKNS